METTKAYIGEWNIEIFQKIQNYSNIVHFYESFPDKKIFMPLETDPKINSPEKAQKAIEDDKDMYLFNSAKDILKKTKFSQTKEKYDLVRFSVRQLGFPNGATMDEIYKKAGELGLELCPAEVGPHLRLQSLIEHGTLIAMEQIVGHDSRPGIFCLCMVIDQLGLDAYEAEPGGYRHANSQFVFCFRKKDV